LGPPLAGAMPSVFAFTRIELKTYLILSVCWVSIVVVNMLEQPYARSLVVCEDPVNTTAGAAFSGSKLCGNRLHVIDVGAKISGKGQSLENIGRIVITFFVSGFADRGRRRAAIVGQLLITVSTALFFLAGFLATWAAIPLYVVAQGLQGMSGIGILDQIITGDVALQLDDTVGVYKRKNTFMAMLMFCAGPLICYIQYAEFTDFTWVWLAIVGMNTLALLLIVLFFPETLPSSGKPAKEGTSLLGLCQEELKTFWSLISSNFLIKCRLTEESLFRLATTQSIAISFMMASFGLSQINALLLMTVPFMALTPFFLPLYPYLFEQRPRFYWQLGYWVGRTLSLVGVVAMPLRLLGVPFPFIYVLLNLPFSGFLSVVQAVEIRLVGAENNGKYQALMQLAGFLCEVFTSYFYTRVFDATATTYLGKNFPFLVSGIPIILAVPVYVFGHSRLQLAECDKIAAENAAKKLGADAPADAAPGETKKTS